VSRIAGITTTFVAADLATATSLCLYGATAGPSSL
jgi:hypothetical protein